MKALLVYPEYPDTFWSFRHALKFTGKKAAFPPLGLLTVAAMFPKEWEVRLVDENVSKLETSDIHWADIVFVSAMLAQSEATMRVLNRCRDLGKKTVLGGPMATADPDRFIGLADHLVLWEAEVTLPRFLQDLEAGNPEGVYKQSKKEWVALRSTPLPRWDLIRDTMRTYSSMVVQFGRGCPYGCDFCYVIELFGRRMRLKPPKMVVEELETLFGTGWRGSVFFVDDNFIGNKSKAKLILGEIVRFQERNGYPFQFYTQLDITLAGDEELIGLMTKAGFFRVFIGIETPETESLKGSNKHHNVTVDIPEAVKRLLSAGIQVQGGFVIGFDSDTKDTIEKMIRLIQDAGVMTAMVGTLQALPGTKLYARLKAEGRLLGCSTGDNTDGSVGFVPKQMTREELGTGYRRIMMTIYSPEKYHRRLARFLEAYRPNALLRHEFSWGGMKAFLLSILLIGVVSRARRWYWKSLREAIARNTRAFPEVVEHWIFWFHFDRVARKTIGIKPAS